MVNHNCCINTQSNNKEDEICTLLGYYTLQSGNFVQNYHSMKRDIPGEQKSHLHDGRSLISCKEDAFWNAHHLTRTTIQPFLMIILKRNH